MSKTIVFPAHEEWTDFDELEEILGGTVLREESDYKNIVFVKGGIKYHANAFTRKVVPLDEGEQDY